MIPGTTAIPQPSGWQAEMAAAVTDPAELLSLLGLGEEWLPGARAAARLFPLRIPHSFLSRIRRGDPHDPLLRQILPLAEECRTVPDYRLDPVGDLAAMAVPGVLHKYDGRVLLTVTGACAVHCRYCFRRHFDYGEANPMSDRWGATLAYLNRDTSISEVILSGGDPLSLSDRRLGELVRELGDVGHLQRLRLHTRTAVVLPSRITLGLLDILRETRLRTVMVTHINHAQEIDDTVRAALGELRKIGVILLNQSVLLRGINDRVDVLAHLSEALFSIGVLPYYLHLLDPVQGAAHFKVDDSDAQSLRASLLECLPGYLVPRVVREIAGAPNKVTFI
jgi:EF-P beta-lysylation protein EpmB